VAAASIDWCTRALDSEVRFSEARGGVARSFGRFIHIHNPHVPWIGDFNRTLGVRVSTPEEFAAVVEAVEALHRVAALERPNRYETHPAVGEAEAWLDGLPDPEARASRVYFLCAEADAAPLPAPYEWAPIPDEVYLGRWAAEVKAAGYDPEGISRDRMILERKFIQTFRPFWLLVAGAVYAWVQCAVQGPVLRLFDVTVEPSSRGRGIGRRLLQAARLEAARVGATHVLVRCGAAARPFYLACGFEECARGTVIRR
jgi:GNAT superfamily N-acetyltransferase